jgi:hypothetical protein
MKYKVREWNELTIVLCRSCRKKKKKNKLLSLYSKQFDYSLGGYSHRERWSCTRWSWKYQLHNKNKISTSSAMIKNPMMNSTIHSHREGFATSWRRQLKDFRHWNSQTKAHDKILILKPLHRDKVLECRGRKDHEGKTPGSILHGLVYAHECALLVNFCIHNTNKIPVDTLGTLRPCSVHAEPIPRWNNPLEYLSDPVMSP